MLTKIWLARRINEQLGGALVGPWDVDDLPAEWVDALVGMGTVVPKLKEGKEKVAAALERWRKGLKRF